MRYLIILLTAALPLAASATEPASSKVRKAFTDMFPANQVTCPDGVPDDCVCMEFENRAELPLRYSRVQQCVHPVLEDVRNMKTFLADGAIIVDAMLKSGQLHGAVISWHPNGRVEGIANYNQGTQIGFARVWHDNGQLAAEQRFTDGEPHGREIRYSRDGVVETVIVWNHGEPEREATRALSQSLGLTAPFDRKPTDK